jgi:hypothetical protein
VVAVFVSLIEVLGLLELLVAAFNVLNIRSKSEGGGREDAMADADDACGECNPSVVLVVNCPMGFFAFCTRGRRVRRHCLISFLQDGARTVSELPFAADPDAYKSMHVRRRGEAGSS